MARHPNAVRDTADDVDDAVSLHGETYAVDSEGVIQGDPPAAALRALADAYGLTVADLRGAAEVDADADSGQETDTCTVVKSDGEVCGRELPCQYHSDD